MEPEVREFMRTGVFFFGVAMMVWCTISVVEINVSKDEEKIEHTTKSMDRAFKLGVLFFLVVIAGKQLFG